MTTGYGVDIYQPLRERSNEGYKMGPFGQSPPSSATSEDYVQPTQRLLSSLESSNNDNNRRIASMSGSTRRLLGDSNAGSSVTGRVPSMNSFQRKENKVLSNSLASSTNSRASSAVASKRGSSKSSEHAAAAAASSARDGEDVVIEEKRKRANGDGYTYHRYLRGRMLGKGGFAKVYLCTSMDTNKQYAVKVVPKSNLVKARARQKLQAEIKIHRTLKHKYVCEFKHFFEDRDNCYILLELCHNQSMNEMIKRRKRLTEPEAAFFMSQLLLAVRYVHDSNVIHRDLKLGNLFLDKNIHIKVGDLGLATRVEDKDEKRKTICGTPNYIAPEVIQGDKSKRGHSFEVDIWSMGVILYTILIGKPPYEAKDVKATYQRILNNEYSFPSHTAVSDTVRDLIESMLQSKPADRPALDDIESHPFLARGRVPASLPSNALHSAPVWIVNEYGDLEASEEPQKGSRKHGITKSRQPFGFRDPNAKCTVSSTASSTKSESRGVDMQRIVRSALVMSGASSGSTKPATKASSTNFKIFDESGGLPAYDGRPPSRPPQNQLKQPSLSEEMLLRRTKALSLADSASACRSPGASSAMSCMSTTSSVGGGELEALHRMVERLDTVLEIAQSCRGSYGSQMPRPTSSCNGPQKWVTRYVDYTSKYGLGFLLNDGSSGVYFNDSTKIALEAGSDNFQYIERKKTDETDTPSRRPPLSVESFTLTAYPDSLKKKVTLLKHFRNYLLEQNKGDDESYGSSDHGVKVPANLLYVKKWVRTKHAILFRLSNQTVQVVFYDQSEILLTPDDRFITYVDKSRNRSTYSFNDDLVGSSPELEKRLKYTKDIISQLLAGRR